MTKASVLNRDFYRARRVLVTGHTGFKGAWLAQILHQLGALAQGYALPAEKGCLFENAQCQELIGHVEGDLGDADRLSEHMAAFRPEIVLHLAAQAIVKDCFDDPYRAYGSNVMGTVGLFEAVRACPSVKSVLVVTTDKVYENKGDGAAYEVGDPLGGVDPYSASKTCMEHVAESYKSSYLQTADRTVGVATARASNVIAGGDHVASRLIPSILEGFAQGKPAELRNPAQTRPWQSALDALNGYLTIARRLYERPLDFSSPWNIGPAPDGICSVGEVFERIQLYFGASASFAEAPKFEVRESETLGLSIGRSVAQLGWSPEQGLDKILFDLTDYFKRQQKGEAERSICAGQIQEFFGIKGGAPA